MLSDAAKAEINRIRDAAETNLSNQLSLTEVLGQTLAAESQFGDIVIADVTWYVGYGIEQQLLGPARHLSISHFGRIMLPARDVLVCLLEAFGFDLDQNPSISVSFYPYRGNTAHILQHLKLLSA